MFSIGLLGIFFFFVLYFEVLLFLLFLRRLQHPEVLWALPKNLPKIAVIVPCYNEEQTVSKTLDSLLALNYPKNLLSIIAVDDGSRDTTFSILERYQREHGIRALKKENGGKWTALNLGLSETDAELLGCLDADSYVEPGALIEIIRGFEEDPSAMAMTPAIKVFLPKGALGLMQKAEYEFGILLRRAFADAGAQFITPGPFSFYRREVFTAVGPFRHGFNTEDLEMGLRMQRAGMRIGNAPRALVWTSAPKTLPSLFRQRVRWAYGFLRNSPSYRNLFFNFRNVALGFFVLPGTLLSIFAGAWIPFSVLRAFAADFSAASDYASVRGVESLFTFPTQSPDWFTLVPGLLFYIMIALYIMTVVLMLAGKWVGGSAVRPDRGTLVYLLLYGILSPLWLVKAVVDAALARGNRWR